MEHLEHVWCPHGTHMDTFFFMSPLTFGDRQQKHGPRLAEDVSRLIDKGVDVYIVREDLAERGLEGEELIDGLKAVSRAEVPRLFENFDQVWHW